MRLISRLTRFSLQRQPLANRYVSNSTVNVFDRDLKARQREMLLREPIAAPNEEQMHEYGSYYDYLRAESARQITDRIRDITRTFPICLDIGSYRGHLRNALLTDAEMEGGGTVIGGIEKFVQFDMSYSPEVLERINEMTSKDVPTSLTSGFTTYSLQGSEEDMPFEPDTFDLVLSNMQLHWVNDLPSALKQVITVLKPDGAFIASFVGGNTLKELRYCFYLAEQERKGGMSSHASPMATAADIAGLMQSAGFAMPTVDIDTVTITYPNAFTLMEHLWKMGEGAATHNRQYNVGRDTLLAMASIYQELFGVEEDGSVKATFEIIYVIGWGPDVSQPKACKRGSADRSLKDLSKELDKEFPSKN